MLARSASITCGADPFAPHSIRRFYRGLGLKLCRAVPMNAIGFLVYEETMRLLQRMRA